MDLIYNKLYFKNESLEHVPKIKKKLIKKVTKNDKISLQLIIHRNVIIKKRQKFTHVHRKSTYLIRKSLHYMCLKYFYECASTMPNNMVE